MSFQQSTRTERGAETASGLLGSLRRVSVLAFVLVNLFALLVGCSDSGGGTATARGNSGKSPSLDARGGATNSDVFLGTRFPAEGIAGPGGEIRVASLVGTIDILRQQVTAVPPVQTLAGAGGLVVRGGEDVRISGAQSYTFIDVQGGGTLSLINNTLLRVSGDVRIAGKVRNKSGTTGRVSAGPDLTILATGSVVITGNIDCSGADSKESEGGKGGEVFIVAGTSANSATDDLMFISGNINSRGGSTESLVFNQSTAGDGGEIKVGSWGTLNLSGKLIARAGKSVVNNAQVGPRGGTIHVLAVGNVLVEQVREVNASGGESSGDPGSGGSIIFQAANSDLVVDNFAIENFGGKSTNLTSTAGDGGFVSLNGMTVSVQSSVIRARGGDADPDIDAIGGNGGTVSITAADIITADAGVLIKLDGGDTTVPGLDGGGGGSFVAIPMDEVGGTLTFDGRVIIRGGKGASFAEGPQGTYCATSPDSTQTTNNIIGTNFFPLSGCSFTSVEALDELIYELDNDASTLRPGTMTVVFDLLGIRVFRIYPALGVDCTITVTGQDGDLDIFVVDGDSLATVQAGGLTVSQLTQAGNFFASAETAPAAGDANEETITVTSGSLGGIITAQGYFLLVVEEQVGVAEEFTIQVQ